MSLPTKRSRTVWSRTTVYSTVRRDTFSIVEPRAEHVLRLRGYAFFNTLLTQFGTDNDGITVQTALSAIPITPDTVDVLTWFDQNVIPRQSLVDFWSSRWSLQIFSSAVLTTWQEHHHHSGWQYTDLLVPELSLIHMGTPLGVTVSVGEACVVEYEYVKVSVAELAAVNLMWGRDPQDAPVF